MESCPTPLGRSVPSMLCSCSCDTCGCGTPASAAAEDNTIPDCGEEWVRGPPASVPRVGSQPGQLGRGAGGRSAPQGQVENHAPPQPPPVWTLRHPSIPFMEAGWSVQETRGHTSPSLAALGRDRKDGPAWPMPPQLLTRLFGGLPIPTAILGSSGHSWKAQQGCVSPLGSQPESLVRSRLPGQSYPPASHPHPPAP